MITLDWSRFLAQYCHPCKQEKCGHTNARPDSQAAMEAEMCVTQGRSGNANRVSANPEAGGAGQGE